MTAKTNNGKGKGKGNSKGNSNRRSFDCVAHKML